MTRPTIQPPSQVLGLLSFKTRALMSTLCIGLPDLDIRPALFRLHYRPRRASSSQSLTSMQGLPRNSSAGCCHTSCAILRVGLVHARWGYLNAAQSLLTRAQALFLDMHVIGHQSARASLGLPLAFTGSAGIWRRRCIVEAGGWESDTLAEDLDLSYRAQLRGWQLLYVPELIVPTYLPSSATDFALQQSRWAAGSIQVLKKLGTRLLRAHIPFLHRIAGLLQLSSYSCHPLTVLLLVVALPMLLLGNHIPIIFLLILYGSLLGPLMICVVSQKAGYADWLRRLSVFPLLLVVWIGIAPAATLGILKALLNPKTGFFRTPKGFLPAPVLDAKESRQSYLSPVLPFLYLLLIVYSIWALCLAIFRGPSLVPLFALDLLGFACVGVPILRDHIRHR